MESAFRKVWTRVLLALVVLALSIGAFAQGGTGELTGQLTDTTGAVVSGVQIKLTNNATGEVRTTVTTPAGTYRIPALPVVGTYALEIADKGFKSVKVQNIVITVGTITTRDIKLEVGAITEQVTVEAGQQLVQTEDSALSQLIDRRVWQQMPLESRDQNSFINLTAGSVQGNVALNANNGGTDRGAAVNGARSGTGDYLVEGFDNNDQGLGGGGSINASTGGANTTISPDAIEEYRVINHNFSAEYGKAGGFVTDTVLKSGTNQWHGSLFEYNRIQALAANNFFTNEAGGEDHLVRNQFGGSVGGPIIKDRTFFYFSTEFQRLRVSSPLTGTVLTPDFLNFVDTGGFADFMENNTTSQNPAGGPIGGLCFADTGATCPGAFSTAGHSGNLGSIFKNQLLPQGVPLCTPGAANCVIGPNANAGGGLYTGGLWYPVPVFGTVTVAQPSSTNQARYTVKMDHKISTSDSLTGEFLYDNADSNTAWAGGDSTFGPSLPNHARAMQSGVSWNHTFSPTLLNVLRMGYVRHTANFPGDPASDAAGVPSIVTAFDPYQGAYGNSSGLPQFFTENNFLYKDDLSFTKGKHNLKAGASYNRTRNGSSFFTQFNGFFLPYGVEDLLTDMQFGTDADNALFGGPAYGSWYYAQASINPTVTPATRPVYYRGFRANEVGAYFQDDWRATSRLTLNLGLRWDYFGPPHNFQSGLDSNLYTGSTQTPIVTSSTNPFFPLENTVIAGFSTAQFGVRNHEIWNKDTNNFGPRVGFAWDATGRQKLVVRGGFGIAYDRMYNNIFENLRFNPPFYEVSTFGAFPNGVPGSAQETPGIYTVPFTGYSQFNNPALFPNGLPQSNPRAIDQNLVTAYYEQTSFGVQYQIAKDMVLQTNYVGTFGRKLVGVSNLNTYPGRTAFGGGTCASNPDVCRPNTTVGNINLRTNAFNSNYNALQTTLTKRFSNGLVFNANYTYAKALDEISDTFTPRGQTLNPTDSLNPGLDYGPSDFDVTNRFVLSFSYDLPVFKGNRWLGGWSASGIVSLQTGVPFSLYSTSSSGDVNKNGTNNDRLGYFGPGKVTHLLTGQSPAKGYFNTDPTEIGVLTCPASVNGGLWCEGPSVGQTARGTLYGPGYQDVDFSVAKKFKITEATSLQFQANFFNLTNRANFAVPAGSINSGTFGQSTATVGDPRITQLALRFDF